jgi:single-stranded DNA-specific DHH superfamily exonuclease
LLIAVDCGTGNGSEITKLRSSQPELDSIVIDHHEPNASDPFPQDAEHILHLNPKAWRNDGEWEPADALDKLCAAGLVYLFAWALCKGCREWQQDRAMILAGLATCTDVVPLIGINRVLLKHSLALANTPESLTRVPALECLKAEVGPRSETGLPISETTYGFLWGPPINAAGRMRHAEVALNLLMASSFEEAKPWARECVDCNKLRKATQRAMEYQARQMANTLLEGEDDPASTTTRPNPVFLTLASPAWHPGVVGIVASTMKTDFARPAIVATALPDPHDKNGLIWTGSGRSVPGCPMGELFHRAAAAKPAVISKGGGHAMAGGLSFSEAQRRALSAGLEALSGWRPENSISSVEVVASPSELAPLEWGAILRRLAPFGNGNEAPALIVEVAELRNVHICTHPRKHRFMVQAAHMQKPGFWAFTGEDIRDPVPLIERLVQDSDPISTYVRHQLSERVVQEIANFKAATACKAVKDFETEAESVKAALATDLTRLLNHEGFHNEERFRNIRLRWQTKALMQQSPSGSRRAQLNRMLLEDAYPRELKRRLKERLPKAWGYEGEFQDKLTGRVFHAVWPVLEEAEVLWQPHRFLAAAQPGEPRFELPYYLRLQLEVSLMVPSREWSNVYRNKHFERDTRFRVRQCIRIDKGRIGELRMPVVKRKVKAAERLAQLPGDEAPGEDPPPASSPGSSGVH